MYLFVLHRTTIRILLSQLSSLYVPLKCRINRFRISTYGLLDLKCFGIRTCKKHSGAGGTLVAVSSIFPVLFSVVFCSVVSAQAPIETLKPTQQAASQSPRLTEISKELDPLLAGAKSLVDIGMVREAEHAVRQYLDKHRDSADGHFLLGYILFREIQENAGVKADTAAATYSEKIADGSNKALRDAKAKSSLAEYTTAAKAHDPSAFDLKIVALDYVLLGDYPDADKWLTRSLERNAKDSEGWYYLGRTKYNENRFAEAISAFEQCLKLDPQNVKTEDNLGLSYAGLGRKEEAIAAYQQAMAWQSGAALKNPGPYIDLGDLLMDENRPEEAVSYLLQAIEIAPRESRAHELLGKAYTWLDQLPKAQTELEKAVELSPQSPNLHCMLAPVYRKQAFNEKAKLEYERCAALTGSRSVPQTPRP
jgi:Flp pilus assembly protein TadD